MTGGMVHGLLGLMLILAFGVVFARSLLISLITLSLFSMLLTMQYLMMHAPDVALTEATLGVGLSPLVFLVAIRKTGITTHDKTQGLSGTGNGDPDEYRRPR